MGLLDDGVVVLDHFESCWYEGKWYLELVHEREKKLKNFGFLNLEIVVVLPEI